VIKPDRQYMGERAGGRISPPVGRQNSIRIWSVDTLSLWGHNIASVSAHVKQPPIRTRDEGHRG